MSRVGRVSECGKFLNEDLRRNINQDVVEKGGDLVTGYFSRSSSEIELKKKDNIQCSLKNLETIFRNW